VKVEQHVRSAAQRAGNCLICESSFAPFLLLYREPWSKSLKLGVILSPSVDAVDAKFSICNLQSISQAGRRRFESGLPLQNLSIPAL
jgi:hypothetical protein